jgi:hypothetical protein
MLACQWPGMATFDQWVVDWNVNRGGSPEPSSGVCGNDSVFHFSSIGQPGCSAWWTYPETQMPNKA